MHSHARALLLSAATLMLSTSLGVPASAAPLDAETCKQVKTDHDALVAGGIRDLMAKGPAWAKTNVTAERMGDFRRFLLLEEDIRFRCGLPKARPEQEAAEREAGATVDTSTEGKDGAAPAASGAPALPPPSKPAPRKKKEAAAAPASATEAKAGEGKAGDAPTPTPVAAPKPKPKPKPKAEEAAAAPAPNSTEEPKPKPRPARAARPADDGQSSKSE